MCLIPILTSVSWTLSCRYILWCIFFFIKSVNVNLCIRIEYDSKSLGFNDSCTLSTLEFLHISPSVSFSFLLSMGSFRFSWYLLVAGNPLYMTSQWSPINLSQRNTSTSCCRHICIPCRSDVNRLDILFIFGELHVDLSRSSL